MGKRILSTLAILVIGLPALMFGGLPFYLVVGFLLVMASFEYSTMFRAAHHQPSRLILLGGTFFVSAARAFYPDYSLPVLEIFILLALAEQLLKYERGRESAVLDFVITVSGLVYIGWLGSYLLDLRRLEDGAWWFFLAFSCVWMADVGAYTIGAAYGRHKMAPRLSPKKSWEGYWAGVFTAILTGMFFAFAFTQWGPLQVPFWLGGLLGLLIGLLTPLGDLGESMFKRQVGLKDSGNIIPGHGGVFDRIDSWLWAAILGYYFIVWFL